MPFCKVPIQMTISYKYTFRQSTIITSGSHVRQKNSVLFLSHTYNILLSSYYNIIQMYHLKNKIDLDKLHQKDVEDMMFEINEKTQRWISRLRRKNQSNEEIIKM